MPIVSLQLGCQRSKFTIICGRRYSLSNSFSFSNCKPKNVFLKALIIPGRLLFMIHMHEYWAVSVSYSCLYIVYYSYSIAVTYRGSLLAVEMMMMIMIMAVFQAEVGGQFSRRVAAQRAVQLREITGKNVSHDRRRQVPQTSYWSNCLPPHSTHHRSRPSRRSRSVLRLDTAICRSGGWWSTAAVRLRPERPPSGRASGSRWSGALARSLYPGRSSTQHRGGSDEQGRHRRWTFQVSQRC